jgi:nucleotide-binding universal stress UspA family protein
LDSSSTGEIFMKVLIGIDGSEYSDAALSEIAGRTWPKGTEILVVHACEIPLAATTEVWALPTDYYQRLDQACLQNAEKVVKAALAKLSVLADTANVTSKIVTGAAKRVILDEAERWKPDLIVVGSHGYPTWERLLLGSVSQAIVSHAKCSVEVVRLPAQKKAA